MSVEWHPRMSEQILAIANSYQVMVIITTSKYIQVSNQLRTLLNTTAQAGI